MVVIDEFTKECFTIHTATRIDSRNAIEVFADLMEVHGIPEHIRSDNGPEMVAKALRKWLGLLGTKTIYITPGSPGENGYCKSFNGKLWDELLKGELFYTLKGSTGSDREMEDGIQRDPASSLGYPPP